MVDHPAHYAGDGEVDCMRAMRSAAEGWAEAGVSPMALWWSLCAMKYLWRWPLKGGAEDVRKARQCLDYLLGEMAGE